MDEANTLIFVAKATLEQEPVSINMAYTTFRGKRKLTKKGKTFKDALALEISRATADWNRAHRTTYQHGGRAELHVTLFFKDLCNKTWVKGGKVATKYKKKDASNYIKLVEDAVAKGSGIDDCFNLDVLVRKRQSLGSPRVEVTYAVYADNLDDWAELMEDDG